MALIICPECGGKVSDKADACIHCGYPIKDIIMNTPSKSYKIILTGLPDPKYKRNIIRVEVATSKEWARAEGTVSFALYDYSDMTTQQRIAAVDIKNLPSVLFDGLSKENADALSNKFTEAGATVKIEESDEPIKEKLNILIDEKERGIKHIDNTPVACPECGSTQIFMHKVNYGATLTLLGSNVMENVCQRCGHRWRPGKE